MYFSSFLGISLTYSYMRMSEIKSASQYWSRSPSNRIIDLEHAVFTDTKYEAVLCDVYIRDAPIRRYINILKEKEKRDNNI